MFNELLQEWLQSDEGKAAIGDGSRGMAILDFAAWLDKREKNTANNQDFGKDYLEFYPSPNHVLIKSKVVIDGSFTAQQLRNIANELDRLEAEEEQAD